MSPIRLARLESAMRVVIEFNQALNRRDLPSMMRLTSDDCIFQDTEPSPDGSTYVGKAVITQHWQEFFRASPHTHFEIEEIFGLGERCVLRWRYEWTDAAGNQGHIRGVDVFKVKDGLICEKFSYVKG